ncbi:hypothetical protein ScPMuIL_008841 [Solemya velum]
MGVVKQGLWVLSGCFVLLTVVIVIRTLTFSVRTDRVSSCKSSDSDFIPASDAVVGRFRSALRYQTVSTSPHIYNRTELDKLRNFIISAYPQVHASSLVKYEVVANFSLLYTIRGSNLSLTPYMLISHLDVVPAEPEKWDSPPFDANIIDGFIYGRGALDDKHGVMATLEALEYLLSTGFTPKRTLYIGFGHDEEVAGEDGASAISQLLTSRGVTYLEFLIDEGLTIINGIIPGINKPVALIGTSEKGQTLLELTVMDAPGHSSMPPRESTIGILANAVARLEAHPQPSMFGRGPEKDTFEQIAPDMNILHRVVMSNLWIFHPLVSWVMSWKPATNAVMRTVTSVTMFNAGIKNNVIPPVAKATVNHRIHPAQTVDQVIEIDRQIIGDDRVRIEAKYRMEALPISPCGKEDFGYQTIKNSIRQVWNDTVVAPDMWLSNMFYYPDEIWNTIQIKLGFGKIWKNAADFSTMSVATETCYRLIRTHISLVAYCQEALEPAELSDAVTVATAVFQCLIGIEGDSSRTNDGKKTILTNFYKLLEDPEWHYPHKKTKFPQFLHDFQHISEAYRELKSEYREAVSELVKSVGGIMGDNIDNEYTTVADWLKYHDTIGCAAAIHVGLIIFVTGMETRLLKKLENGLKKAVRFNSEFLSIQNFYQDAIRKNLKWPKSAYSLAQLERMYNTTKVFQPRIGVRPGALDKLAHASHDYEGILAVFNYYTAKIYGKVKSNDPNSERMKTYCEKVLRLTKTKRVFSPIRDNIISTLVAVLATSLTSAILLGEMTVSNYLNLIPCLSII